MTNAKVKEQQEESKEEKPDDGPVRRVTTDELIRRPTGIFKVKAEKWKHDFLVKGAL